MYSSDYKVKRSKDGCQGITQVGIPQTRIAMFIIATHIW